MVEIKEYIKELLLTNQGVIIPGFGGFISEYEPASFDVTENKFLPPSKKISFKSDYSYYDSLLIDFISKKKKIDKDESKKLLENFVQDIKQRLKKGEKIEFPEIGVISQNQKGIILFNQSKDINLLTDSFGLKSVKTKNTVAQTESKKPIQKKSSRKTIFILSSSLIVLTVVIVGVWYFTDGFTDFSLFSSKEKYIVETNNDELKEITEKHLDSIAEADSIKALIVNSIDDNTDKKDALFYKEPTNTQTEIKYSKFHIIAGSFKKMENAQKFSDELTSKGYKPEIIKSEENLIRIAIFSYTNETEALKQLYKLRENAEIKSVWILKSI